MHAFMAAILLRLARVDPLELDAKARPPSGESRQPGSLRHRRERLAIVRTDRLRQTLAAA